ncbi:MAG: transposase [Planctomycetota bacterium]
MKDKTCRQDGGGTKENCREDAGVTKLAAKGERMVPPASSRQVSGLRIRSRGRLPHWEKEGSIYFITFRLNDSIPQDIANAYQFERENIIKTAIYLDRPLTDYETERLQKLYSSKIESYLDKGIGNCYLRQRPIAQIVLDAFEYFHNERYKLYTLCIMPNHVHVLFRPFEGYMLEKILHSWKSYTSTKANELLNRSGVFWQKEYYDHLVRNELEFNRIAKYILENPEKAGLKDWPWVKVYEVE